MPAQPHPCLPSLVCASPYLTSRRCPKAPPAPTRCTTLWTSHGSPTSAATTATGKVAETFTILAALYPGRIDLGIGRAAGTDPVDTESEAQRLASSSRMTLTLLRRGQLAVTIAHDHGARRRSYELLADAFGLEPRSAPQPHRQAAGAV